MFKRLYELALTTPLMLTISANADTEKLTLNVIPTPKKSDKTNDCEPALTQKLSLTAAPEEFEQNFPGCLAGYIESYQSLVEQMETSKAVLEAAKQAQIAKTSSATKNTGRGMAKVAAAPTKANIATQEDDEASDDTQGVVLAETEQKDSLFD